MFFDLLMVLYSDVVRECKCRRCAAIIYRSLVGSAGANNHLHLLLRYRFRFRFGSVQFGFGSVWVRFGSVRYALV